MDDEGVRKPGTDPRILLRLSEQFLRRRHLDDCRNYAHQAYQLDPDFPGVTEILAVADVLLASKHQISTGTLRDWYEVLQINRYSQDSDLIRQRFNRLYGVLNPSKNKLPFADEAFHIVCDAWYVLSNPSSKLEFDDSLKKLLDDEQSRADSDSDFAFWTVCPYCYHLYEFPRVYLELCLRCPNEKCSKAFTCVEIDRPPADVLNSGNGKYMCPGFLQLGFQNGCWNPFTPLNKQNPNQSDDTGNFVKISDDDDDDEDEDDEVETKRDNCFNVGGDGVHEGAGCMKMEVNRVTKNPNVRRKKSVAKNTKKVTGAGNRVRKEGFLHPETTDDCEFF